MRMIRVMRDSSSMLAHRRTTSGVFRMMSTHSSSSSSNPFELSSWATCDPDSMSKKNPCRLYNMVNSEWSGTADYLKVIDPMNGDGFIQMPNTSIEELSPFIESSKAVKKTGLHNPFKNVDRYLLYGDISHKAAAAMEVPEIEDFFVKCIQRVMPKSREQAYAEVFVSRQFLKNFGGDNVRFMASDFGVTGDHDGQHSRGFRFPFGSVGLVCPFNFPLEIPVLQLMGALYMGNKPIIKSSEKTSLVIEQFIRLLHACGMPLNDVDLIHSEGAAMEHLILNSNIRFTQFTGSARVAERLLEKTRGKVKIEDAGFDWKILGPDVSNNIDHVAFVCDQDAYALSGQKCSAQSMLFIHKNYINNGFIEKIKKLAARRTIQNLSIGPVLSVTNEQIFNHINELLKIDGSFIAFGGQKIEEENAIPATYGSMQPTAIYIPLENILASKANFDLVTTEIFGPFQILTSYTDSSVDQVLECCERMSHHLTAGIVSNDVSFQHKILGNTVNGTTYVGLRARTTGAPANHWFGPAGDPRGAGIGTREAIKMVWSCHREIIEDKLPVPEGWTTPEKPT